MKKEKILIISGTHGNEMSAVQLGLRLKKYYKNEKYIKIVPFLNGGLFECLDDKTQNLYIDGFSDQMTKGQHLVVPDYLFFGATENVDLSADYRLELDTYEKYYYNIN